MSEVEHFKDCDGNGWQDCWKCLGEGAYDAPDDDITDVSVTCDECDGKGGFPCPACRADHPDDDREDPREVGYE